MSITEGSMGFTRESAAAMVRSGICSRRNEVNIVALEVSHSVNGTDQILETKCSYLQTLSTV